MFERESRAGHAGQTRSAKSPGTVLPAGLLSNSYICRENKNTYARNISYGYCSRKPQKAERFHNIAQLIFYSLMGLPCREMHTASATHAPCWPNLEDLTTAY